MEEVNNGELDTLNQDEVTEEVIYEAEETVEELKARLSIQEEEANKAKELADNYKTRAEKAEGKLKIAPKANQADQLSPRDLIALTKANIHEDDITEVQEYAKFKNISLADAINSSVVKTLLSEKNEQRRVASATNVNASKRSSSKVSEDVLLDKASKGEMPESDDDIDRLIEARLASKKG